MKIYTYGIIDSNAKISDCITGLEDVSIYNIPYRDIGVVVSRLSEQIQNITKEHILKHEEVVERLMEDFTVLPGRFLTVFNKEEDIFLMMKEYYSDFRENLDRLCNKVEFGIKIIWPGNTIKNRIIDAYKKNNTLATKIGESAKNSGENVATPDNSSVKSFVKEKFEKYNIDKEFEEEAGRCIMLIDNFFTRFVIEKKLEKLKTNNLLLNASYLIEKEKQIDFKEAFEHLRSTPGDLKFLMSGPWPPYNFIQMKTQFMEHGEHKLLSEFVPPSFFQNERRGINSHNNLCRSR